MTDNGLFESFGFALLSFFKVGFLIEAPIVTLNLTELR